MILLVTAGALGASTVINTAINDAHDYGVSTRDDDALKAEFDRGMAAGVEYQEWFCKNEVAALTP